MAGPVRPTGFFRVERKDGVWWIIDPEGGLFLSKGVVAVNFDHDSIQHTNRFPYREACQRKYGSREVWRAAAARRLLSWNFNTLGAWSDGEVATAATSPIALTAIVDLAGAFRAQQADWPCGMPDVFDPEFASFAQARAREICAPRASSPNVIGWFTDNELPWAADWRGSHELLPLFLSAQAERPGCQAAVALLRGRYENFGELKSVWRLGVSSWDELAAAPVIDPPFFRAKLHERVEQKNEVITDASRARFFADCDAFAGALAERYFEVTGAAIRNADPNHLVLGCRFAYVPQRTVIEAAARHSDVIGFNCYEFDASASIEAYARSGKPCLIGEFSFRGEDSGLPNTIGAGPRVANQGERARCFQDYVDAALRHPTLVGYHWFLHTDQPAEGRFDGENSNYGVVSMDDTVYDELTRKMTMVNEAAERVHRAGAHMSSQEMASEG